MNITNVMSILSKKKKGKFSGKLTIIEEIRCRVITLIPMGFTSVYILLAPVDSSQNCRKVAAAISEVVYSFPLSVTRISGEEYLHNILS